MRISKEPSPERRNSEPASSLTVVFADNVKFDFSESDLLPISKPTKRAYFPRCKSGPLLTVPGVPVLVASTLPDDDDKSDRFCMSIVPKSFWYQPVSRIEGRFLICGPFKIKLRDQPVFTEDPEIIFSEDEDSW